MSFLAPRYTFPHRAVVATALASLGLLAAPGMAQVSFHPRTDISIAPSQPNAIAAGHMNGDLHVDLVTGNQDGTLTVFLGDGTGGFSTLSSSVNLPGAAPVRLDLGDLDGDGDVDAFVIIAINGGHSSLVMQNDGTGQLVATTIGLTATDVVCANITNGLSIDFAIPDSNQALVGNFCAFLGCGLGAFDWDVYPTGNGRAIAAGDLDNDNDQDLVVATSHPGGIGAGAKVEVLLNAGNGMLASNGVFQATPSGFTYYDATDIECYDLDGDGNLDVLLGEDSSNGCENLRILWNDGTGSFSAPQSLGFNCWVTPWRQMSVASADFDEDGLLDVISAANGIDSVSIMFNEGGRSFAVASPQVITVDNDPRSIVVADFDEDGKPDVATANGSSGTVSVLLFDRGPDKWIGPDGGNYMIASNWDSNVVPDSPLAVAEIVNSGPADNTCAVGAAVEIASVLVEGAGSFDQTLRIGATGTMTGAAQIESDGTLELDGGSFDGAVTIATGGTVKLVGSASSIDASGTGTLRNDGRLSIEDGSIVSDDFANAGEIAIAATSSGLPVTIVAGTADFVNEVGGEICIGSTSMPTIAFLTTPNGSFVNSGVVHIAPGSSAFNSGTLTGGVIQWGSTSCSFPVPFAGGSAAPAILTVLGDLTTTSAADLQAGAGKLELQGNLDVAIDDGMRFDFDDATVVLFGSTIQTVEVMGSAFKIGTLEVRTGTTAANVNAHVNTTSGDERLYVGHLVIEAGAAFETNGIVVYYETAVIEGDVDDLSNLIQLDPTSCAADLDGSGDIGFADLTALLGAWGSCGNPCPADLDGSGDVGFTDLTELLGAWGACSVD